MLINNDQRDTEISQIPFYSYNRLFAFISLLNKKKTWIIINLANWGYISRESDERNKLKYNKI